MGQRTSSKSLGAIGGRLIVLALAAVLAAQAGAAEPQVYHSPNDDGVDPGAPLQIPEGASSEPLFLYIDAGSQATGGGVACSDGDGEELCAFEVMVEGLGGIAFVEFFPNSGIVHQLSSTQLKANGLFALAPQAIPRRIGELRVQSNPPGGTVMMMVGTAIGAALQTETVPQSILATTPVPEPAGWLQLGSGGLLLAWLGRRRSRRASR